MHGSERGYLSCKPPKQRTLFIQWHFSLIHVQIKYGSFATLSTSPLGVNLDWDTVSTESPLTEAGNFVLTASGFQWLAANFGFCAFGKVLCISANTHRCIIWVKPKLILVFIHDGNFHLMTPITFLNLAKKR